MTCSGGGLELPKVCHFNANSANFANDANLFLFFSRHSSRTVPERVLRPKGYSWQSPHCKCAQVIGRSLRRCAPRNDRNNINPTQTAARSHTAQLPRPDTLSPRRRLKHAMHHP